MRKQQLPRKRRVVGPPRVEADLTTVTYHPTKGYRRIAGRRVQAIAKIPFFTMRWAQIAAAVR